MVIACNSHPAQTTNYIWDNKLILLLNSMSQSPTWRDPRVALHAWGASNILCLQYFGQLNFQSRTNYVDQDAAGNGRRKERV